jgi:hypothetical protein
LGGANLTKWQGYRAASEYIKGVLRILGLSFGRVLAHYRVFTLFPSSILRWSGVILIGYLSQASFGQEGYRWVLDLVDVEISVGPVVLSEELKWIVGPVIMIPAFFWEDDVPREGPLEIYLIVKAKPDAYVEFDPREFRVLLEDGRSLSANRATPWPSSPDTKALEPVELSGEEREWRASLRYDVSRVDLQPFTLQLGVLIVNGRVLPIPALSFEAGSLWQSS